MSLVPRELVCAEIVSRLEFVVALHCHDQLRLYVELCVTIELLFWRLDADGAKLFECTGQDKRITLKERNIAGVEMMGRRE